MRLLDLPISAALLLVPSAMPASAEPNSVKADVSVCFTPPQRCGVAIIREIDKAEHEIRVQAFGFTHKEILAALVRAHHRGVDVRVILDRTNDRSGSTRATYSGATYASNAGIPVWIDDKVGIAHNKIMVIDGQLTIGGSFNFTAGADTKNAENVTFTQSKTVAGWFVQNWEARLAASRPFVIN